MAEQNQEIPVDPASFPLKRKRGRPRKYDSSGYEPQRRYSQPQVVPTQANPAVGYSQRSQVISALANPAATLSLGPQVLSAQVNPTISSISGMQPIPTQVNSAVISRLRPEAIAVQPNLAAISTCHSASPEANISAGLSYGRQAALAQANVFDSSGKCSHRKPLTSFSHGPYDLLGHAVSGILDGTFDAGYLLTVRVGSTGDVLKGLVFDPQLCIPVSANNDIAPLLPALSSRGNLHPVVQATNHRPMSSAICPVPMSLTFAQPLQIREPAAPTQPVNQEPEPSRLPQSTSKTTVDKQATNDTNPGPQDGCQVVEADVQAKNLQSLSKEPASSVDQESQSGAPLQLDKNNAESEILSGPSHAIKETSKVSAAGQTVKLEVPPAGPVDRGLVQTEEGLRGGQSLTETEESSEKMVELEDHEQQRTTGPSLGNIKRT